MLAGRLRKRITIQQPTVVRGASGEAQESWSTFATVWARVAPYEQRNRTVEGLQAASITNTQLHVVTLRYLPGLTTAMRVLFGTRILQVTEIVNLEERNREMHVLCIEGR
jgi:SPP1 family predicted phage head-tail adaptor